MSVYRLIVCCILSSLLLRGTPVIAQSLTVVHEDFESYLKDGQTVSPIADQGAWKSSPYGKPGGLVVSKSDNAGNATVILTAPAGGDHHARLLFDRKTWEKATTHQAWCLELKVRNGMQLMLGVNPAYNPKPAIQLKVGKSIQLVTPNDKTIQSINKLPDDWFVLRLIIQQDQQNADTLHAWVAVKALSDPDASYMLDPSLRDVTIDISDVPLSRWDGIKFRIDHPTHQVDDLTFQAVDDVKSLLADCVEGQVMLPFLPLLDHITSPRQALDLGGVWQLAFGSDTSIAFPQSSADSMMVLVPGEHTSMINSVAKFGQRAWFFRDVMIPEDWAGKRVTMHCERVTDQCDILVNNQHVGHSDEAILPFAMDITDALKPGQSNRIAIGVLSTRTTGNDGTHRPVGWTWFHQQFNGIPLPVHLQTHASVFVSDVIVKPALHNGARLTTQLTINNTTDQSRQLAISAQTRDGQFQHTSKSITLAAHSTQSITLSDTWDQPRLWWPHDPHLYQLQISISEKNQLVDCYSQRLGFREMRVAGHQLLLNDVPFMHRRNSIIPYLSTMQPDTFASMVRTLRQCGYVGSRLHGGPSMRLLSMADELGWLISPESAINEPRGHQVADDYWPHARDHAINMVRLLRNHPSVIYWGLCNEFGSNYMPSDSSKGPWVDQWLNDLGKEVMQLDPTRTVTFDGENDLGGRGHAGPAPTLNFHYAWQPFKPTNMIPTTRNWLLEGGMPWQAIAWDQSKPIMLGEDMYDPYCIHSPYGSAQWGGNNAYDPQIAPRVTFDAYHMLAEGYYRAGVAVWNPWGLNETRPAGKAYVELGQSMPDYLCATDEVNRTFASGQTVNRTLRIYNMLFADQQATLESQLLADGKPTTHNLSRMTLKAGQSHVMPVTLPMPSVQKVKTVQWQLRLVSENDQVLCDRIYEYTVFPSPSPVVAPQDWAVVGQVPLPALNSQHFETLDKALATNPKRLLLAGVSLSDAQGKLLDDAVSNGLHVTWIATPAQSWLPAPLKTSDGHRACFAFISRPDDPLMQDLTNNAMGLWGDDTIVASDALLKPDRGNYEVILACGAPNGLTHAAMLRMHRGKGSYLMCQMPLLTKASEDPAANELLHRLINTPIKSNTSTGTLAVMVPVDSSLPQALNNLRIPFIDISPVAKPHLLMIDASQSTVDAQALASVQQQLSQHRSVWLQRPSQAWCDALGLQTRVTSQDTAQVSLHHTEQLLAGLDNDDFYWQRHGKDSLPIVQQVFSESESSASLNPAGLLIKHMTNDAVIIACQLRWDQMAVAMPQRSGRIIRTLLNNAGVDLGNAAIQNTHWKSVDIASVCNRDYRSLFGQGPDLSYFPVNRIGLDPVLHVPRPVEAFTPTVYSEDVPFTLTDPQANDNRGVMVLSSATSSTVELPIVAMTTPSIWMMGTASDTCAAGDTVAKLQLTYSNGQTAILPIVLGLHTGSLTHTMPLSQGRIAWSGRARFNAHKPEMVYLYAWNLANPHPQWTVTSMRLISDSNDDMLGVVAVTLEQ